MKSVENWLYDWAMNVEMREGRGRAERRIDRQAAENDEGIYTDNLFNNFMSSKSNKSYKRHNDDGDDDDDDDGRWKRRRRRRRSEVRQHRRTAPNDAAQVEVEQREGAEGEREIERRESSSSPSWVVYLVLFGFGLAFWSAAASL